MHSDQRNLLLLAYNNFGLTLRPEFVDTELLRTFLEVNKTGHYAEAAENLFVTQSAISARVIQLEKLLGVSLFDRRREGLRLNAHGTRFLPFAESIVVTLARARQEMAITAEETANLRLGSTSGLWRYVLSPLISQEDGLAVSSCVSASVEELLAQVEAGLLDMAITFDIAVAGDLVADKLGSLKLAMLSANSALSMKDPADFLYVSIDWGTEFAAFQSQKLSDSVTPTVFTNLAEVAESVVREKDNACAYLPTGLLGSGLHTVSRAPKFSRKIYALYRTDNPDLDLIKALIARVSASLAE
ncbi:MAG: DNA-binding transcriptional LysR family regulator [Gammaproteobacteria bacterium]